MRSRLSRMRSNSIEHVKRLSHLREPFFYLETTGSRIRESLSGSLFDECDRLRRHVAGEVSRLERERVLTRRHRKCDRLCFYE